MSALRPLLAAVALALLLTLATGTAGARVVDEPGGIIMYDWVHATEFSPASWAGATWAQIYYAQGDINGNHHQNGDRPRGNGIVYPDVIPAATGWGTDIQYASQTSEGRRNHAVAWLREATGGNVNGTLILSNGTPLDFYINYTPGILNSRLTWGIWGGDGLSETSTGAGEGLIIDIFKDANTSQMYAGICRDSDYRPIVLAPIGSNLTIVAYSLSGTATTNASFYEYDPDRVAAAQNTKAPTAGDEIAKALDLAKSIGGALYKITQLGVFFLSFIIWIADPINMLMVIVLAECVILIFALEERRKNIFHVVTRWATLHYDLLRAAITLTEVTISIFAKVGVFIYSILHALLPI